MWVRTLVPSEVVYQNAGIVVVIQWTSASSAWAWSWIGTIGLGLVLQRPVLEVFFSTSVHISEKDCVGKICANLIIPGASSPRVGTLISGEKVDQHSRVSKFIFGARASPCSPWVTPDERRRLGSSLFEGRFPSPRDICPVCEESRGGESDEASKSETCYRCIGSVGVLASPPGSSWGFYTFSLRNAPNILPVGITCLHIVDG